MERGSGGAYRLLPENGAVERAGHSGKIAGVARYRSAVCQQRDDLYPGALLWETAIPDGAFFWSRKQQGEWEGACIWIKVPYDPTHSGHPWHCLSVYRAGEPKPPHGWLWDGNLDRPTLSPSIACGDPEARDWHGHMREGRLEGAVYHASVA